MRKYRLDNRDAMREYERTRYYNNPEPKKQSRHRNELLRLYGLTLAGYANMVEASGGVCNVCREPCKTGKRLAVDHDHNTGDKRGLLCFRCNSSLGRYEDNIKSATPWYKTYQERVDDYLKGNYYGISNRYPGAVRSGSTDPCRGA